MNWIIGIQRAVDYIEDHLMADLEMEQIAKAANASAFHFQRVFHILSGFTVSEYIRNRRLTLAAGELQTGGVKIIDIALRYGYDTPESFSRAFERFHGVLPSAARRQGTDLKSFSRIHIKVLLEGGSVMDYRIKTKPAIRLLSKCEPQPLDQVEIPAFWEQCFSDGSIAELKALSSSEEKLIIGMADGSSFDGTSYLYYIGTPYEGGLAPEGYTVRTIPASTWAIFRCVNLSCRAANEEIFRKIYAEFFPTSEYEPKDLQLEVFPGDGLEHSQEVAEVWINISRKGEAVFANKQDSVCGTQTGGEGCFP